MTESLWVWVAFNVFILAMLALDLGVFHRKAHVIGYREALIWTLIWVVVSLLFNVGIYFTLGSQPALEFLTGYLIEKSLSVDNIFVFLIIFQTFRVPAIHQHRVLFWGVLGALVFRAIFIAAGITLIETFHVMIYLFGALLIYTGLKMAFNKGEEVHPEQNPAVRLFRRFVPVAHDDNSGHFTVIRDGRRMATPLLVALVCVEVSDIIFAVDSIPAILAITRDPFLVYTSNVFAILGLRSLYFALAGFLRQFHHLHYGLAFILSYVGVKMLLVDTPYKIPTIVSLGVIATALALSVIASRIWPESNGPEPPVTSEDASPSVAEPIANP